jgi:streptogramin lyase
MPWVNVDTAWSRRVSHRLVLATVLVALVAGLAACERPTPLGTITTHATSPSAPRSIVTTSDGTVWFANTGNGTIGRRSPDGVITNFAADGLGPVAGTAIGPDGNVWFTLQGDKVGTITPAGAISTFPAQVTSPMAITAGPDGNLWYVGALGAVAKRTPAGVVSVYPGSGLPGSYPQRITAGPDGNLWYTTDKEPRFGSGNPSIVRITTTGAATAFTDPGLRPGTIVTGPDGNLWFTNAGDSLGRITPAGTITLFHDPAISSATDIVAGPDGNLWFTNGNRSIGRITTSGVVTAFSDPALTAPSSLTATPGGMWFTDVTSIRSGRIGHITTAGAIQLDAQGANFPVAIAKGPDASVWFANFSYEADGSTGIGRIDRDGKTQVFFGTGLGPVQGIAAATDGSAWFTCELANSIGRVTPSGAFTSFAHPSMNGPRGITRGTDGNMWFTNRGANTIGRITPTGSVTTFAHPSMRTPTAIVTAADGGMWFKNHATATVGRIDTAGAVRSFVLPAVPTYITTSGNDMWFTVIDQDLIGRVTPSGAITTFSDPIVDRPGVLAADGGGHIFFGNDAGASIGRMKPGGTFTSHPVSGSPGYYGMVGGYGDIWFTNGPNNSITRFGTAV